MSRGLGETGFGGGDLAAVRDHGVQEALRGMAKLGDSGGDTTLVNGWLYKDSRTWPSRPAWVVGFAVFCCQGAWRFPILRRDPDPSDLPIGSC